MATITPTKMYFVDTLRKAIGDVCSAALVSPWTVVLDESDSPLASETSISLELQVSGGLPGRLGVQIKGPDALLLAQKFLSEPSDPTAELKPDHKEALEELWRQVAGQFASGLKGTYGEVKFEVRFSESAAVDGTTFTLLATDTAAAASLALKFYVSNDLSASLLPPPSATETSQAAPKPEGKAPAAGKEPNFDLLMGVNLNLTLRFGQCVMALREVLALNSGSVIELDREVHEPADLLLGDKLIARGEVVIVDGNYGLRITEVADARQRINTI